MSATPKVERGRVLCPNCGGRLVGMADVTVHPTVRVREGCVVAGPIADAMRGIRQDVAHYSDSIFGGDPDHGEVYAEIYCFDGCDYTIGGHELKVRLADSGIGIEREGR